MTALLLQYLKLIMLLLLIGSIVGLSHFPGETRKGSASANAEGVSGWTRTHRVRVRNVGADRRNGVVSIGPRQRRFKPLFG
jgi:hypothetical protein